MSPRRLRRLHAVANALALAAVLVLAFGASLLAWTSPGAVKATSGGDSFGEISAAALGGAQRLLKGHEVVRVDVVLPPATEVAQAAAISRVAAPAVAPAAVLFATAPVPSLRL